MKEDGCEDAFAVKASSFPHETLLRIRSQMDSLHYATNYPKRVVRDLREFIVREKEKYEEKQG